MAPESVVQKAAEYNFNLEKYIASSPYVFQHVRQAPRRKKGYKKRSRDEAELSEPPSKKIKISNTFLMLDISGCFQYPKRDNKHPSFVKNKKN